MLLPPMPPIYHILTSFAPSSPFLSFFSSLFCFVLFCFVLFCIVLYCIVLYCIVLYCIVLYCIVLYCIVLYCIVLYVCLFMFVYVCLCLFMSVYTSLYLFIFVLILETDEGKLTATLQRMDEHLHVLYQALPENTLMVVATLQGDVNYWIKLQIKANADPLSVTQEEIERANLAARQAVSFFVIK